MKGYLKSIRKWFWPSFSSDEVSVDSPSNPDSAAVTTLNTVPKSPDWKNVLTESLRFNCLAPSDEAVLHAFDLYSHDLYAPFHERQQQMAGLYAGIAANFGELQALIPQVIERAMARNPWEFSHIIEHKTED